MSNNEVLDDEIFEATHQGTLELAGKRITCAVLDDKTRVITQTALFKAFERPRKGEKRLDNLPSIVGARNLEPFVSEELYEKSKVIQYKTPSGTIKTGYDANIIPLICDLYLEANEQNDLHPSQYHIYRRSFTLVRALATVGITALIDEATGYQYDREAKELQTLLEAYISKDLMKWQKRFPNQYYREIYRLYGWAYDPQNHQHTPYIGKFTNNYIYDLFPNQVMEEIKKRNPVVTRGNKRYRRNRNFQFLTTDIGLAQLDQHISKLLGVMKLSKDIEQFKTNFRIAFEDELLLKQQEEQK